MQFTVFCKANGDRNQLGAWLDSDQYADWYTICSSYQFELEVERPIHSSFSAIFWDKKKFMKFPTRDW